MPSVSQCEGYLLRVTDRVIDDVVFGIPVNMEFL